jgi:hypothetical protein
MRRILSGIAIIIALLLAMSILWIFGGQRLSLFLDRFGTIEIASAPIESISYKGTGTGGDLLVKNIHLSLSAADPKSAEPHFGTTKDEQLALSLGGKVFAFGPLRSSAEETLAAQPQPGNAASITIRHSFLCWPNLPGFRTARDGEPLLKRYQYYELVWRKQSGAKLEMNWRREQDFYPGNGWVSKVPTPEGASGLIRVDISDAGR